MHIHSCGWFKDERSRPALLILLAAVTLLLVTAPGAAAGTGRGQAQAGPPHLSFYDGRRDKETLLATKAGWCLVGRSAPDTVPPNTVVLPCSELGRVFAGIARQFYPRHELDIQAQETPIHPSAKLGEGIVLAPGVIIGPNAEIGDGTRIGAYSVIGRGVR